MADAMKIAETAERELTQANAVAIEAASRLNLTLQEIVTRREKLAWDQAIARTPTRRIQRGKRR